MGTGLDQEEFNTLMDGYRKSSAGSSGGNSAARSSSGGPDTAGVVNKGIDAMGQLTNGTFKVKDAVNLMGDTIGGVIPVAGGTLGKAFTTMSGIATDTAANLQQTGKMGVTFGGNMGEARDAIFGARLNLDSWSKMLEKSSTQISGMGMGMDKGAKAFLNFNADIQNSNDQTVQVLKDAGMSQQDFADVTRLSTMNMRAGTMQDKASRDMALQSTIQLADEMDSLARLTGKSKQQQQDDVEKQLNKANVMATLRTMDEAGREQFIKTQTQLNTLGPRVMDLAGEISTGGVRTKEGMAAMAALGPAGKDFEAAVRQQQSARTESEKAAAQANMDRVKAEISQYQSTKGFVESVNNLTGPVGDAQRDMVSQNKEYNSQMEAANIKAKANAGDKEFEKYKGKSEAEIMAMVASEAKKPTTQKGQEGAAAFTAINKAENALGTATAAINKNLVQVNQDVGKQLLPAMGDFQRAITNTTAKINQPGGIATGIKEATGLDRAKTESSAPKGYDPNTGIKRKDGSPGIDGFLSGGNFNSMFENFGSAMPATLHGEETVATKDQMQKILQKTTQDMQKQMAPMANNMQKQMAPMMDQMQKQMTPMFEDMQKQMTPMIDQMQKQISPMMKGMPNVSDMMKGMGGAQGLNGAPKTQDDMIAWIEQNQANMSPEELSKAVKQVGNMQPIERLQLPNASAPKMPDIPKITPPAPKPEEKKPTYNPAEHHEGEQQKASAKVADVTMKDLKEQLVHLNRSIDRLVSHSADTADAAHRQVKATKSLTGNKFN